MLKYSLFFLLLCFNSLNSQANHSDDDDDDSQDKIAAFSVSIDDDIIQTTGIQTQVLKRTKIRPEVTSFATRVDLSPLLLARTEYFAALAQQAVASISLQQSRLDFQHFKKLNRENIVTKRKFLAQKTQLALDQANFKAAQQYSHNIRLHTQTSWGLTLSEQFLSKAAPDTAQALYLVYLPQSITQAPEKIAFQAFSIREQAQTAKLISGAYKHAVTQQIGAPFYYLATEKSLAYHYRVAIWLATEKQELSGFIIPESALVWHLGQAYIYLQMDEELFKRVAISDKKILNSGQYFIQQNLNEGDILVITGAQMLLSEEFRGQIPAEDDDD